MFEKYEMSNNYSNIEKNQNMSNQTIKNDKITKQKDEKKILIKKNIEDDVLTRYRNKHT